MLSFASGGRFKDPLALALLLLLILLGAATAEAGGNGKGKRDTTPPSVSISAPPSGTNLAASITVSGSASDNVSVAKVTVSVDGGASLVASGTTNWSLTLNTAVYADGTHTITARATDASGNTSAPASVSVTFSNTTADTVSPSVTIVSPAAGATLSGAVSVAGTASDNVKLAKVELSVDGGGVETATGTSSWSLALDTTGYANGTHTLTARATDTSGNTSASSTVSVTFSNDTMPPTVTIASPTAGATLSGTEGVSGTAADNAQLAKVELSVDGGAYAAASGSSSWSFSLNTAAYSDGSHTLTARATDAAGNVSTSSESVSFKNSSALPPGVVDQLITPEGVKIQIYSDVTTGWTAQQIYDLLKPNAYQLSLIGPHLTIKVQTTYASSTSTSAGTTGTVYTSFNATLYLDADPNTVFPVRPDSVIAHEYGHVWTMYHLYLTEQGNWTPWLQARGLAGDSRVDSSYIWSKNEMIADDYRMLFGDSAAVSQAAYINPNVPDPRTVAGLKEFFVSVWGA